MRDERTPNTLRKIIQVRALNADTFVLRMERQNLIFQPGQCLLLGLKGDPQWREYSIYSSEKDDYIEVLIKKIPEGYVSPRLGKLQVGDTVNSEGPLGSFTLEPRDNPYLFVATGTGIAPFHSFCRSFSRLNYHLIHGIRSTNEAYEKDHYNPTRLLHCVSQSPLLEKSDFAGRSSDYIRHQSIALETLCYLCGNGDMIHELSCLLQEKGIPPQQIFSELYF